MGSNLIESEITCHFPRCRSAFRKHKKIQACTGISFLRHGVFLSWRCNLGSGSFRIRVNFHFSDELPYSRKKKNSRQIFKHENLSTFGQNDLFFKSFLRFEHKILVISPGRILTRARKMVHYRYMQCCGSETIYSGSGSSLEFSEFRIRIQAKLPDPCGSGSILY